MSTNNIQIFQFKIEMTLVKTGTLNAGISPLIAKRNHLNIRHFAFLSDKSTQTEYHPKYFEIYINLDETIKCASRWFIKHEELELFHLTCVIT